MREIKFRGWNTITKTMLDLKAITPLVKDSNLECDGLFLPFTKEIILMQFTGLHDKNGREIYAEDKIAFTIFDHNDHDTQYEGIVKFASGEWQIWNTSDSEYYGADGAFSLFCVHSQDDEIEIIGDTHTSLELIHDTPEENGK